jgi:hypothetical protein
VQYADKFISDSLKLASDVNFLAVKIACWRRTEYLAPTCGLLATLAIRMVAMIVNGDLDLLERRTVAGTSIRSVRDGLFTLEIN